MTPEPLGSAVELRLIDPSQNRLRLYFLTECRTLWGEPCLRIVWGRLGHRRLRDRSEVFPSWVALEARRRELLLRRQRHGYVPLGTHWAALLEPRTSNSRRPVCTAAAAEQDIVEAHGLALGDQQARKLVASWYAATSALRAYMCERAAADLDLEDVSTLAAMYTDIARVA